MGWYLRKSLRLGPLRINLSKSGIGGSVGVRGLRVGTGPKGPYLRGGREGLYFKQSLSTRAPQVSTQEEPQKGGPENLADEEPEQQIGQQQLRAQLKDERFELQRERSEREQAAREARGASSFGWRIGSRVLQAILRGLMRR